MAKSSLFYREFQYLEKLYHAKDGKVPSDTRMREVIDPVKPIGLKSPFKELFSVVQRNGALQGYAFNCGKLKNCYLLPDGTGLFYSGTCRCDDCGIKMRTKNETFNTLKKLEHNYGHGEKLLATNSTYLTFLALLVDQIQELACPKFQQAIYYKNDLAFSTKPIEGSENLTTLSVYCLIVNVNLSCCLKMT